MGGALGKPKDKYTVGEDGEPIFIPPPEPDPLTIAGPHATFDVASISDRSHWVKLLSNKPLRKIFTALEEEIKWEADSARKQSKYLRRKTKDLHVLPALDWQYDSITSLNFSGIDISAEGDPKDGASRILLLASYLKRRPAVETLCLRSCKVGPDELCILTLAIEQRMEYYNLAVFDEKERKKYKPENSPLYDLAVRNTLTTLDLSDNPAAGVWYDKGFSKGKYDPKGVIALGGALEANRNLTCLDLGNCNMGAAAGSFLVAELNRRQLLQHGSLTYINMANNALCGVTYDSHRAPFLVTPPLSLNCGFFSFCHAIEESDTITAVDFSTNVLYEDGCLRLVQALAKNKTVTSLKLDSCKIARCGNGGPLESSPGFEGVMALGHLLGNRQSPLTSLDLSRNMLTGEHPYGDIACVEMLAEGLERNESLLTIDLSRNFLREKGAALIAEAISINRSLTCVKLASNELAHGGAAAVARALQGHYTLRELDLSDNFIGREQGMNSEAAMENLMAAVNQIEMLTKLDLSGNMLHVQGAKIVCTALKHNKSLRHCGLSNNYLGEPPALQLVADLIILSNSLRVLDISSNSIAGKFDFDHKWVPLPDNVSALGSALRFNPRWVQINIVDNNLDENDRHALKHEFGTRLLV
jgi:Ran GTPase-activating protein (RanGAP) involved in mRNA processing and transport